MLNLWQHKLRLSPSLQQTKLWGTSSLLKLLFGLRTLAASQQFRAASFFPALARAAPAHAAHLLVARVRERVRVRADESLYAAPSQRAPGAA
jgi:hypothetical protein